MAWKSQNFKKNAWNFAVQRGANPLRNGCEIVVCRVHFGERTRPVPPRAPRLAPRQPQKIGMRPDPCGGNARLNSYPLTVMFWPMNKFSASELLQLPIPERLQLVEDIWNSIADAPEALELTDEDKRLIDERLASRKMDPAAGSPWQDIYNRITSKPK